MITITFEGPRGSGKSTLIEYLRLGLAEIGVTAKFAENSHQMLVTLTKEDIRKIRDICYE